jgi:hypothetical protein
MIPIVVDPLLFLRAMAKRFADALAAQPAAETITLPRDIVAMALAGLADTIDRVEEAVEGSAAADRLIQELAIAKADVGRLETRIAVMEARGHCPRPVVVSLETSQTERAHRRGTVIDLTEEFGRERREAGMPTPPTGGDAA